VSDPVWGVGETGTRHAFRKTCGACRTEDEHRRNHKPHSVCGHGWAVDWPVIDIPRQRTCRRCLDLAPADTPEAHRD
jgi:hypothetical protein